MSRFTKMIAFTLCGLLLAVVAAPYIVPTEHLKTLLTEKLGNTLKRPVSVETLRFSFFPSPSIHLLGVKIANPSGIAGDFIVVKDIALGAAWQPLLHKELRVDRLIVDAPEISLTKQGDVANWQMGSGAPANHQSGDSSAVEQHNPFKIGVDNVVITHGKITLQGKELLSEINITVHAPQPEAEVQLEGSVRLKGQQADGKLTLDRTQPILKVSGDIHMALLQADAFLGKKTPDTNLPVPVAQPTAATPTPSHWSDAPILLTGLKTLNLALKLTIDELDYAHMHIHNIVVPVTLANGDLRMETNDIQMYDGTLQVGIHAQSNNNMGISFIAKQLDIGALLRDIQGNSRLSGKLTSTVLFGGHGNSEREMISTMGGHGDFSVSEGAVKGINLVALSKLVSVLRGEQNQETTTSFSTLTGSFVIPNNGVLHNPDLTITSPLFAAHGEGDIDWPAWQVHYTVMPRLNGTTIDVPVHIEGPLDTPSVHADAPAVLHDMIKNPEKLKDNLKQLRNNLRDQLHF